MEIINIRQFMNVIKYKVFLGALFLMLMSSCGLDLQTNYDYRPSIDDPHIQMTVWEYMSKNQDDFSIFQEAITYVGLEDYYRQIYVPIAEQCSHEGIYGGCLPRRAVYIRV